MARRNYAARHKAGTGFGPPAMRAVFTIGHSTRAIEEFVHLLKAHGVEQVIDIRSVPRSRVNPQFNRDTLAGSLKDAGIEYMHMPELGGLRHPRADSPNTAWRNESFRGYADYMQTPEFAAGIDALIAAGTGKQVAIMCAEAVPWRCHRSLVGDALTARGIAVEDIMNATRRQAHKVTPFARLEGTRVWYPGLTS
jgi:uncharacterized protein (DUF488 family)